MVLTNAVICLAAAVYFESRSEEFLGRLAVAKVVMNRVKSERFPDSVCAVIKQKRKGYCAFTFLCDKTELSIKNINAWVDAVRLASTVIGGSLKDPTHGATHYHTTDIKPYWAEGKNGLKIGNHIFYKGIV